SIVVRKSDGTLVSKTEELRLTKTRHPAAGWPLIRGIINFGASMVSGVRALMYSASFFTEELAPSAAGDTDGGAKPVEESKFDKWVETKLGKEKADSVLVMFSVVLGIAVSVGLFMLLPTFLAGFLTKLVDSSILKNLIEGVLRIAIFIAYIGLTSLLSDMRRVWMYHGAEHKTIFCYERDLPLTVENVRAQPRCHPRCGTSFLFIVMIVSILVFSLLRWQGVLLRIAFRLLLLPVVVAVSYEIIKWAGRHDNVLTRLVSAPGKALQRLTTREPDDSMIEVAIAAVKEVLPEKTGEDAW
ncbi:MAG: DUF1385 domain-containing protein, partial [Oscillospiraceae bacterium]|nr:DUF1385 domain-containing protein [Oscillospiraceae bacterium]